MVPVYLLDSVLEVYERVLLNSFYPSSSQFAFLRTIFPSPASSAVFVWQNAVLLQAVPFLLFFYLAVRMGIDPMGRVLRTAFAIAAVGACLSVLNSFMVEYQLNISSLLLTGSVALPITTQSEPLSDLLASIFSPIGVFMILGNSAVFAALGMTGVAFGNFSGETPYWILKRWLASRALMQEEDSIQEESIEPNG